MAWTLWSLFLAPIPFCLAREKVVVVPVFNRVRKDWFDVCLCLWIVKIVVLTGLDISMSSRDVFLFLWDVSEEVRGRIFSSCYDLVLPTSMQRQCPEEDEA